MSDGGGDGYDGGRHRQRQESSDDNSNGFVKVRAPAPDHDNPLEMDYRPEEAAIGRFSEATAAQVTDLRYEDISGGGPGERPSPGEEAAQRGASTALDSLEAFLATEERSADIGGGDFAPPQEPAHAHQDAPAAAVHGWHADVEEKPAVAPQPHVPSSPGAESGADTLGDMVSAAEVRHGHGRDIVPDEEIYAGDRPLTVPQLAQHTVGEPVSQLPELDARFPEPEAPVYHTSTGYTDDGFAPPPPPVRRAEPSAPPMQHEVLAQTVPTLLEHGGGAGAKTCGHTCVLELVYWRDPKKSAAALLLTLAALFCLARFTVLSLAAYGGLLLLAAALTWRVYEAVLAQLHKPPPEKPLAYWLDADTLKVPNERAHQQLDVLLEHGQHLTDAVRRLLLIENAVDTVKFGVLLWALTYVGSWISGCALAALCLLAAFSLPKVYEVYQEPIDKYWNMASEHAHKAYEQAQQTVPFLKPKQQ